METPQFTKVTLCGSLKFEKQFKEWNERLSLEGHIVYTVSVYPSDKEGNKDWYTPEIKTLLDIVHLMKIDNSDAIFVIDVAALDDKPYIGDSTRSEMYYAKQKGKHIILLSDALKHLAAAATANASETNG